MRFNFHQILAAFGALFAGACASTPDDGGRLVRIDHHVRVKSTAPSMAGQEAQIYVREVALRDVQSGRARSAGVVLFVHGAGTPAAVAFDVPYKDYSWMGYLARAGFEVFSMEMTGYGGSTRPEPMRDPCNVPKAQQTQFIPDLIKSPCAPSHAEPLTTMDSDWKDLDAVVEYLRKLRGVEKVSLVGWSQGGTRTGGYAMQHPAKVSRLVVLAPAYLRNMPAAAPNPLRAGDGAMSTQSRQAFVANWERQVGCSDQYEPAALDAVWAAMLASDPVGAKWGPGVRRAPIVPSWGFNQASVAKLQVPYLMIAGEHDKQVVPERVRQLYADLGAKQKVLIELACSSHNAMWEKNRLMLFKATLDWLRDGSVNGLTEGVLKLGY
jgi:pimeloyl-ACP methyl ester carboxylesterase